MPFDITVKHPLYAEFRDSWQLMRDAFDGEDRIKERGEIYLPMKTGTRALLDYNLQASAYGSYKLRAEFPELVSPTVRGTVGLMLDQPAEIKLPSQLEPLRQRATLNGMPLDVLHRSSIATELMTTGRYGLLPGLTQNSEPYLAGYTAESIINWDGAEVPDFVVLDESAMARDPLTGKWGNREIYRECFVQNGAYGSRLWTKSASDDPMLFSPGEVIYAFKPPRSGQFNPMSTMPFVFINVSGLQAEPDDVPLYGLAKISVRIYRLDADYTFSMHMTADPTPVATGFDDAAEAIKSGIVPTSIGSSVMWILPKGGDAKFLEFSGAGINAQKEAIAAALERAVALGAQILTDQKRVAESGDALKLRLGNQASTLKMIAMTSASGLERALKNLALWVGANPDQVEVIPNLDFVDHTVDANMINALVNGWQKGAYSWRTQFERLKKGGIIPSERTEEEEKEYIAEDQAERDVAADRIDPRTGEEIEEEELPPGSQRKAGAI